MTPPAGGGPGDLDMSLDNAPTMLNLIQVPIDAWDKDWRRLQSGIRADEQKIEGFDDISKQFRDSYAASEPGLTERASALAPKVRPAVALGRDGVATYRATLEDATDRLNNVT